MMSTVRLCLSPKRIFCLFGFLLLLAFLAILHLQLNPYDVAIYERTTYYEGEKVKNVALVKVHKSASSTLSSILYRFGVANNLTFLLPRNPNLAQFWPNPITSSDIIPNCRGKLNILNVHTRFFGRANLNRFMPPSTKIISILRHPATQLKSSFNYFGVAIQLANVSLTFSDFIDNPAFYINIRPSLKLLMWNGMSVDLGLMNNKYIPWLVTKSDIDSSSMLRGYVYAFLESVEKSIDLMLISEYFEESIVLLKIFLNWDLEDVTFFSLNKAIDTSSLDQFTDAEINKVIEWNFIDYLLYRRMLNTFLQKMYSPGIDLSSEVIELKSINAKYTKYCVKETMVDPMLYGANQIIGYKLNSEQSMVEKCKQMTSDELTNIRETREYMESVCEEKSG